MTEDYRATLYALGAVPVSELDKKFWNDETDQAVYLKSLRADVNGWLAPDWAKSSLFLTEAEKEKYGIPKEPLKYAEYVSLLDVDGYKQTENPLLYAVMVFALENMLGEGTKIEDCDDIIKVYEADIGLNDLASQLLRRCINSDRAMHLYEKHRDACLLEVFPVPRPEEEDYIRFLQAVSQQDREKGWVALHLLYRMDKDRYAAEFRDFLIGKVRDTGSPYDRRMMYRELVAMGDEQSLEFLAASLLNDPATESREAIILTALATNVCSNALVESIVKLAQGHGERHEHISPSRGYGQWERNLREYLLWVTDNTSCDVNLRTNAEKGLALLGEMK